MARTGDKRAFSALGFAKTESIIMVKLRFWANYHTEPPTIKTIRSQWLPVHCEMKRLAATIDGDHFSSRANGYQYQLPKHTATVTSATITGR